MNTLLFSLLPIYLLGNVHCAGMCGPLVMLLARHPFRWCYFLGRLFSFTLAGLISAELGMAFFSFLTQWHLSAFFSLFFGAWICLIGGCLFFKIKTPGSAWLGRHSSKLSALSAKLLSKNSSLSVFLFGACTVLLPCGQTIVVYSLIALHCGPLSGVLHGFLFALLTSPALIAAMHASQFLFHLRQSYHVWMGTAVLLVGTLALLRGFADLNLIKHFILNPSSPSHCHLVIF